MTESITAPMVEEIMMELPNRFGDCIQEKVIIDKKKYRTTLSEVQLDHIFGNHDYIVSTIFGTPETHMFTERNLAATYAQRISSGGAATIMIRDKTDDERPLILLCSFFNGRIVTYNNVRKYIDRLKTD